MPSLLYLATSIFIAASALADIHPVHLPSGFFPGPQDGGIGSWYRASANADATNGKSWCGYPYYNSDPLFAVSFKAMGGATWDSDPTAWKQQTQKYCGLEAKVTDPSTGKTMLMYIGDAFDDKWIKRPLSIDIMIDAFSHIHSNPNGDKNKVIDPVTWELTGNVNTKYAAPGASWPTVDSKVRPTSPTSSPKSGACIGCLGARCDGQRTVCNTGLTCLSPDGICKDVACNWGCTGWACSATSPCQKPNSCFRGTCTTAYAGKKILVE